MEWFYTGLAGIGQRELQDGKYYYQATAGG